METAKAFIIAAVVAVVAGFLIFGVHRTDATPVTTTVNQVAIPDPTAYAIDTTGSLTAKQLAALNATLKTLDNGTHQFAVLMVNSTQPLDIATYGIQVAEKWKVGDKSTDDGVIIIVAVKDRKIRIEVGKGLEGSITDEDASNIIRDAIAPKLHTGDWYGGINDGLTALQARVK